MTSLLLEPQAPLSVTQINLRAKNLLERNIGLVSVVGEVSNLKIVAGHCYFTLKDKTSQLAAVLFKREAEALPFKLQDGMSVIAEGRLTIYGQYGRYQMVVERLEPNGAGALQLAFEQLKARLLQEGLFAANRKRPLPLLPRCVGVITSPTGAVIRDIVHVATRRFPKANILVIPTKVQGPDAAPFITAALLRASKLALDVIIVARGGGSLEDLWGFNDERVARSIAASPIPVVSAVGHETDFTIADFVADCRAPTPSAAAELVFPVAQDLQMALQTYVLRFAKALSRDLQRKQLMLRAVRARLSDARTLLRNSVQHLAHLQMGLQRNVQKQLLRLRLRLRAGEKTLATLHPRVQLVKIGHQIQQQRHRQMAHMRVQLKTQRAYLQTLAHRVQALSPVAVLERGYSIVLNARGDIIRDAITAVHNEILTVRVAHGSLTVKNLTEAHDG
jgi:exodeoxyribonuclease VII large subunit